MRGRRSSTSVRLRSPRMSSVTKLLEELVAIPTQQACGEGGAGDERTLCELLGKKLARYQPDEVVVSAAPRTDGSPGAYVFARWGAPKRIINAHVDTVP